MVKFTLEQPTKDQRRSKVYFYSFFNLGTRWKRVVNATALTLYPRKIPGTHCVEGWVGPRAGLDRCGKSLFPPGGTIGATIAIGTFVKNHKTKSDV